MPFTTPQEEFWAGDFGSDYLLRNQDARLLASNTALFASILSHTHRVQSAIELGANIGLNLRAIQALLPGVELSAVELNAAAAVILGAIPGVTVFEQSLLGFDAGRTFDLTFTKGVLIHIHPDRLDAAYEALYRHSRRYICIAEYYSPVPVALPYRGHAERLFKRDFAGEMMSRFSDLQLVTYGFAYRQDPNFPQDDITWFLLERR